MRSPDWGPAGAQTVDARRRFSPTSASPTTGSIFEAHPEVTEVVERVNHGARAIPTIIFPDGSHLTEPGNDELADKLGSPPFSEDVGLRPHHRGAADRRVSRPRFTRRARIKRSSCVEKSLRDGQRRASRAFLTTTGFPDGVEGHGSPTNAAPRPNDTAWKFSQAVAVSVDRARPMYRR